MEELELFFANLRQVIQQFKSATGFLFAPIILQKSLFCPVDEFMVIFHKVSQIDVKLPKVTQYASVSALAGAFSLLEFDTEVYED